MRIAAGEHFLQGIIEEKLTGVRDLGLDGVELHFGPYDIESHPLWRASSATALGAASRSTGVALPSVYAGYFHDNPPGTESSVGGLPTAVVLGRLLEGCAAAGISVVLLPLVGQAELHGKDAVDRFAEGLLPWVERAAVLGLTLALLATPRTDLLQALLAHFDNSAVRLAYSVRHSVVLGMDAIHDLKLLRGIVCQVRVGDCTPEGCRVPLGQGSAPLASVKQILKQQGFEGWWVLGDSLLATEKFDLRAAVHFLRTLGEMEALPKSA